MIYFIYYICGFVATLTTQYIMTRKTPSDRIALHTGNFILSAFWPIYLPFLIVMVLLLFIDKMSE